MFPTGPYCKVRAGWTARLEDEIGLGEVRWRKRKEADFNLRGDNRAGRAVWRHRMNACMKMMLSFNLVTMKCNGCIVHCKCRASKNHIKMSGSHLCIPGMKLLFPKQNYNVLSPSSYTRISVRDLYISKIGLPIVLQEYMWTDPGNIQIAHRHMNVEIRTETAQFPENKFINGFFVAVQVAHSQPRSEPETYHTAGRQPLSCHSVCMFIKERQGQRSLCMEAALYILLGDWNKQFSNTEQHSRG